MTIKQLMDSFGGVAEFRRKIKRQQKVLNAKIPSREAMYKHYNGNYKVAQFWVREFYKAFGVTEI